jgi:hypothetical protein
MLSLSAVYEIATPPVKMLLGLVQSTQDYPSLGAIKIYRNIEREK